MSVEEFARRVGKTAVLALEREAWIAPKPGLVDRLGPGAHTDMDYAAFLRSSAALGPCFEALCLLGAGAGQPAGQLLALLRPRGIQAEAEMLAATGGANTHMGAIFSLGILCAAAGWLHARGQAVSADGLLAAAADIAAPSLQERAAGARAEAAGGFPHVRDIGLPVLSTLLAEGYCWDIAGLNALLRLMAAVPDTNLQKRGGGAAVQALQARLAADLNSLAPEDAPCYAQGLDEALTREGLSPGGCADLLAVSCFLWLLPQAGR